MIILFYLQMQGRMDAQATTAHAAIEATQAELAAATAAATAAAVSQHAGLEAKISAAEARAAQQVQHAKQAQEKLSLQASRAEALAARVERLESEARTAVAREHSLLAELETLKRNAARSPVPQARSPMAASQLRRTITQELEAAAVPYVPGTPGLALGPEETERSAAAVQILLNGAVFHKLPPVEVKAGGVTGYGTSVVLLPQAAWLLHKCFLQWAREWQQPEVLSAFKHLVRVSVINRQNSLVWKLTI